MGCQLSAYHATVNIFFPKTLPSSAASYYIILRYLRQSFTTGQGIGVCCSPLAGTKIFSCYLYSQSTTRYFVPKLTHYLSSVIFARFVILPFQ